MNQYIIKLDQEYIFDIYNNRFHVETEKPTIIIYVKKNGNLFYKTLIEFVDNPKSYLHNNPPVEEALNNHVFLLLQRDEIEIDDKLKKYYLVTISRFNKYFQNIQFELPGCT